jgi:hypothetical protein
MKLKLFLAVLIVLCAGQAWGAAISKTVCASGGDYTTIKEAVDYIRTNGDGSSTNTITVCAGTFSNANDYFLLNNATLSNLVVVGAGMDTTIIAPTNASVVVSTTGVGLTMSNLTLVAPGAKIAVDKGADAGVYSFSNVHFKSSDTHTSHLVYLAGDETNISKCKLTYRYTTGNVYPLYSAGDGSGTISYSIIQAQSGSSAASAKVTSNVSYINATGTTNLYNNLILDSASHGLQFGAATGTANVANNIIMAGIANSAVYPILRQGGTVNVDGNVLMSNPWNPTYFISGTVNDGVTKANVKTNPNLYFLTYGRKGFIIPCVDDSTGLAYTQAIETKLAAKGYKGNFFIEQAGWNTANNAALVTMVGNGTIEVGSHSWSHSDLSLADGTAIWTLADCTVTYDRTGTGTLTVAGHDARANMLTTTLANIRAALVTDGCTVTDGTYATESAAGKTLSTSLGEVIKTAAALSTELGLLIDATAATGLFKTEIVDSKTWLASIIGAGNVNTFGYPYNKLSADSRTASIAAGYEQARAGSTTYGDVDIITWVDRFDVFAISLSSLIKGDGTEAVVRANTRTLANAVAQSGAVVAALAHSTVEFSYDQWDWFLDELSKFGNNINVTNMAGLGAALTAGWTDNLNGTYSKTASYSDYHIRPNSGARNAGTDVSLTSDYAGNTIWAQPDIGAYEKSQGADITLGTGVGTSVITSGSGGSMTMTYDYD